MKKFSLITLAALAVVGVASAQTAKTEKAPATIKCAVMPDDNVNIAAATKSKMFADYKGRRYYFCCAGCPEKFKASPAKYSKSPSLPVPAEKKKA